VLQFALLAGPTAVTSAAVQTVYTVPAGKKAVLTKLVVVKTSANAASITLFYDTGGGDIQVAAPRALSGLGAEGIFDMRGETLPEGTVIDIQSTTADEYVFILFGGLEDA